MAFTRPYTKCYSTFNNRVFKTRYFSRVFKSVNDQIWCDAVQEMSHGLIDAQLGRSIVKKRVATKKEDRWFFVYGFNKNDQANISAKELAALTKLADLLLNRTNSELDEAVAQNELAEICHD